MNYEIANRTFLFDLRECLTKAKTITGGHYHPHQELKVVADDLDQALQYIALLEAQNGIRRVDLSPDSFRLDRRVKTKIKPGCHECKNAICDECGETVLR